MKRKRSAVFFTALIVCLPIVLGQSGVQEKLTIENSISGEELNLDLLFSLGKDSLLSGLYAEHVGEAIEILGDINGDGYDDWAAAIGSGAVHVYLGNPNRRKSETAADYVLKGVPGATFGPIRTAGDVNNDGFDDMMVYVYGEAYLPAGSSGWLLYYGGNPPGTTPGLMFKKMNEHPGGGGTNAYRAGDVNNDGFDDILLSIATAQFSLDTGLVYVLYGGSNMDPAPDVILKGPVIPPGQINSGAEPFGPAKAAGDVNNDGFDDVIVTGQRVAKLYYGGENMDAEADIVYDSYLDRGIGVTAEVKSAGDVNNDGYDDIMLGAFVGSIANSTKTTLICFGGESPDNIPDVAIPAWTPDKTLSQSSASLGDINHDGFDDVLIGTSDRFAKDSFQVRIFLGGNPMDSIMDMAIYGPMRLYSFGHSLAGNGDFDGDGFNDFLVGEDGIMGNFDDRDDGGSISIFYGGDTISSTADAIFSGIKDGEEFGRSVAYAGDVNNDGFFDLLIGAPNYWNGYRSSGRAYLYFGGEPFENTPDVIFNPEVQNADIYFGKDLNGAGDVNGDQFDDIYIIENSRYSTENSNIYIFLGGDAMDDSADYVLKTLADDFRFTPLGDVNKDGFDDVMFSTANYSDGRAKLYLGGENMFDTPDETYYFLAADNVGKICKSLGDLNSDGFMDFAILMPKNEEGGTGFGMVAVYFGADTLPTTPDLKLMGHYEGQLFGSGDISGGRDINNDGFDDMVIGTALPNSTTPGFESRSLFIYYGGEFMDDQPDVIITYDSASIYLEASILLMPDLNRDGYDDILADRRLFLGGDPADSIPDALLPYLSFEGFMDENSNSYLVIGDYTNSFAGPMSGRVLVYSNLGSAPDLSLSISDTSISIEPEILSTSGFYISSNTSWSITTSADWLSILPPSGENNHAVKVIAQSANPSNTDSRVAELIVSGSGVADQTVIATQLAQATGVKAQSTLVQAINYPNPFSDKTIIQYQLNKTQHIDIIVLNLLGQELATLITETQSAGIQKVEFNAGSLPAGAYFYEIRLEEGKITKMMLLERSK